MRRILFFIFSIVVLLTSCQTKDGKPFSITPDSMSFQSSGGMKMLEITAPKHWTLTKNTGEDWCVPSETSGGKESHIVINVKNNVSGPRVAELEFFSEGSAPLTLIVSQTSDSAAASGSYPDKSSGLDVDPVIPNADKECTIKFNPASGNPLYNHKGDLYAHLGVIVDGEWHFVPSDWGTTNAKVKFTKVADNSWELKLSPSIREYFESGTTPITKLGLIVRSADGNIKNHPNDQFCAVVDDLYQAEIFQADPIVEKPLPSGVDLGINYNSDSSVTLVLYDRDTKGKRHEYAYVVGDWTDWERKSDYAMAWDTDASCWWITLSGFDPNKEHRFQYRVGNTDGTALYVSDPYSTIIYDQWNDKYLQGIPEFPEGAKQLVSAFQINKAQYNWEVEDFKVKDKTDLIIYEMHFRDFSPTHDIKGALAELDYISNLGVNAVELMPIQEFDGNDSWGYNPNHWFALDKSYGSLSDYKKFIDECHKRGLAVIVDVVYNHATGSHPWAKMWYQTNATADNNPFFNRTPAHPYNVFHDANHENTIFQSQVKRSLQFLMEEYKVDGFRFDMSKGFTQKKTDPNVAAWGHLDQSRINILKSYAEHIWSVNQDAVVILEHFADADEEKILANYGMQLWRNVNYEYINAVTGSTGNFSNAYSKDPFGGFVSYMESHDEERLLKGSNSSNLEARLKRAQAAAAFFLLVPGPKMIWQFGEIGYDYAIDYNGRTGSKPIVTQEYLAVPARKALYDTYSQLLKFRRENPRFFDSDADFSWTPSGSIKKLTCSIEGKTFHLVANFGKSSCDYNLPSGLWKNYFTGKNISSTVTLSEGEFLLLTNY